MQPATPRTVGELLRVRAAERPDAPYVQFDGEDWITLSEMDECSDVVAAGLRRLGVRRGDRVVVISPNRREFVEVLFGCAKLGAVNVPLNPYLKGEFLRHQLADSGAVVLITDAAGWKTSVPLLGGTDIRFIVALDEHDTSGAAQLREQVRTYDEIGDAGAHELAEQGPIVAGGQPSDLMSLLYTSGTTGLPKGCKVSHAAYLRAGRIHLAAAWVVPDDVIFTAFPLFHSAGQFNTLISPLSIGAASHFQTPFSASSFMHDAHALGATVVWGVGAMANAILAQPVAPEEKDYRFRQGNWMPLRPAEAAAFTARFRTPIADECYGLTECNPVAVSTAHAAPGDGSAGRVCDDLEVLILDDAAREVPPGGVGQIVLVPKADGVLFDGYWGHPEVEPTGSRRHATGDLGRLDLSGVLYFVDRKKDAIRRRGESISSLELENAILEHPAIERAAACAVPSGLGEDDVLVYLVYAAGAEHPEPAQLFEFFAETLPYYAIPQYIVVRDALPTNTTGKVTKHVLRSEGVPPDAVELAKLGLVLNREARR